MMVAIATGTPRTPLRGNEIKHRALRFARDCADAASDDAEAKR